MTVVALAKLAQHNDIDMKVGTILVSGHGETIMDVRIEVAIVVVANLITNAVWTWRQDLVPGNRKCQMS